MPLEMFRNWLEWLDSHDGRLWRRARGGLENDHDLIAVIPPSGAIFTVGDLRAVVTALENQKKDCAEVERLQKAIRQHRDYRGDDKCYLDDRELYAVLPEGYAPPAHEVAVTLEQCAKYIACRADPATEYVSPQREIERLTAELAEAKRICEGLAERVVHQSELLSRRAERSPREVAGE